MRAGLALDSPSFYGNEDNFPSHDESSQAQSDAGCEHCIELIILQRLDNIAGLAKLANDPSWSCRDLHSA
jgi:hypothetical protein